VERLLDVGIVHPREVVEDKSEAAEAEGVKFLKDGMLLRGVDAFESSHLEADGVDVGAVEAAEELSGEGFLEADDEDGGLAEG
jgi:hypothetical protein